MANRAFVRGAAVYICRFSIDPNSDVHYESFKRKLCVEKVDEDGRVWVKDRQFDSRGVRYVSRTSGQILFEPGEAITRKTVMDRLSVGRQVSQDDAFDPMTNIVGGGLDRDLQGHAPMSPVHRQHLGENIVEDAMLDAIDARRAVEDDDDEW